MCQNTRFWIGLLVVVALAAGGCGGEVEEVADAPETELPQTEIAVEGEVQTFDDNSRQPPPQAKAPETADFVVTDAELGGEFAQDAEAASNKYKGKWVQFEGVFMRPGSNYILFRGSNGEPENRAHVQGYFVGDAGAKAMNSSSGRKIVVMGQFDEFTSGTVLLNDCMVKSLEADPYPPTPVVAAKVAADFLAGKGEEYDSSLTARHVIEGVVLENRDEAVVLEGATSGDETLNVRCYYGFDNDTLVELKPGDKVKIVGGGLERLYTEKFGDNVQCNSCRLWVD